VVSLITTTIEVRSDAADLDVVLTADDTGIIQSRGLVIRRLNPDLPARQVVSIATAAQALEDAVDRFWAVCDRIESGASAQEALNVVVP